MTHRFLLIAIAGLLFLSGCKYSKEYKAVNAQNQFTISLPPWMKEEPNLKEGAQLQYANRFRNIYIVGTTERKEKAAGETVSANLDILRKAMVKPVVTDSTAVTLGGLPGTRVEIYGKMSEENIYFSEVLLEGKDKYYHLSIWTRGEDRKLRFKEDIDKIFNSFKAL